MTVQVRIPTPLQKLTQNQPSVSAEGGTVRQIFDHLESRFPGIKQRLCDDSGSLRHFINIYLNDEDIRYLEGEDTPLKDGDELSIIPAIAGGAGPHFSPVHYCGAESARVCMVAQV